MQEHEIHTGKDYIVKIANHEVKIKVLSNTCRGWVAKTTSGKFIPINSIDRFVRAVEQVVSAGEFPLQAPTTPAEVENQITVPQPEVLAEVQQSEMVTAPATSTPKPKNKLTMLDATAIVLEKAGHPMTIKDILTAMEESGLWQPSKGLTPGNSLISAIGTEQRRKQNPRFRKTAPGTFEFIGGEHHE